MVRVITETTPHRLHSYAVRVPTTNPPCQNTPPSYLPYKLSFTSTPTKITVRATRASVRVSTTYPPSPEIYLPAISYISVILRITVRVIRVSVRVIRVSVRATRASVRATRASVRVATKYSPNQDISSVHILYIVVDDRGEKG